MKKLFTLIFLIVLGLGTKVVAQSAAALFKRANQQYQLYESERDRGGDPATVNSYLLESHNLFVKVLETSSNTAEQKGAKNRLRAIYPNLLNGAIYFSQEKQPIKFLELATAYIELPQKREFKNELLQRDSQYPGLLYNAALGCHNLKRYDKSIKFFTEFMELGVADEVQLKNCYVCLNQAYSDQKNYAKQEQVLEEAASKFPVTIEFLYHLYNVHTATKNVEKQSEVIDRILVIDPNNQQILPSKVAILRRQGKNKEALELCKRLHVLQPDNYLVSQNLALCYYSVGAEIVNSARLITNQAEYASVLQSAADYFYNAKDLFLMVLEKEPANAKYMQGLAEIYTYLGMKAESEVLAAMVKDGVSYQAFSTRLATYNEVHGQQVLAANGDVSTSVLKKSPKLVISMDENSFQDANGNKVIDAGERFDIHFTIRNEGEGDAYNLRLRLYEEQGHERFFDGAREKDGGHIPVGTSKQYTFTYIAKYDIPTDLAKIKIQAFEQNGFDVDHALEVNMQEYAMPRLRIADYQFTASEGSSITLGSNGKFTFALQNAGMKTARNVKLNFELPANVFKTDVPASTIDSIAPGDVITLDYGFLVNNRFDGDSIAVMVSINEETRTSSLNETYKVKLGEYLTSTIVTKIEGEATNRPKIIDRDFRLGLQSELLENIPVGASNSHRYALIIGNEDYSSRVGANAEINVPYAINDAAVFYEYCVRTFGIPEKQIRIISDATVGMMAEGLDWLISMANADSKAEIFYYYSGHGNNHEATKKAYLLPVDITGNNVRLGLSLDELYQRLGSLSIRGAYVFLDACFSGGYKSAAPILAQKGVRIRPNIIAPHGHTLSFSSSSGNETSSVYHEKKQGYYTYFLLKILQEAGGNLTMREWFQKTHDEVLKATSLKGKPQSPNAMPSVDWPEWGNVQLMTLP